MEIDRREALKAMGLAAVAMTGLPPRVEARLVPQADVPPPKKPITALIMGAGNRGNVYASYSRKFPEELNIVGVAEPIPYRNERMAKGYGIEDKNRWVTWEHAFEGPKLADAVIITTPDHLHYGPAMAALELGYDLLLEKVVAQTWKECKEILDLARKKGRIVAVCHVMRYMSYFRQLRETIQSGQIGEVVSVQHLEPVEHIHMSHSFVRGNWRNAKESNPMILSKSCHDTDILRWLIDRPSRKITSFGSLKLFRPEMAPEGAPMRCSDGCPAEAECPFSALKIYLRRKTYLGHLKVDEYTDEKILKALKEGPYGRCVYHCDNDVVDHQVTNIQFEDDITAAFSMEALTSYGGRRTRVMGTRGDAVGDERDLTVFDFSKRKHWRWNVNEAAKVSSGHGGGDHGLVHDWVRAVDRQDSSLLTSTLDASMESHLMGFMAEESRLEGGAVKEINLEI